MEGLTKDFVMDHNQWVASMVAEKGVADQLSVNAEPTRVGEKKGR